jgi:hypothetical protein
MSASCGRGGVAALTFFDLFTGPAGGDFRFPFAGGSTGIGISHISARPSCTSTTTGDGSLLCNRGVLAALGFETVTLAWLPGLDADLGIDWHMSVPRLTPVDRRRDFAFGLSGRDGGGDGPF